MIVAQPLEIKKETFCLIHQNISYLIRYKLLNDDILLMNSDERKATDFESKNSLHSYKLCSPWQRIEAFHQKRVIKLNMF